MFATFLILITSPCDRLKSLRRQFQIRAARSLCFLLEAVQYIHPFGSRREIDQPKNSSFVAHANRRHLSSASNPSDRGRTEPGTIQTPENLALFQETALRLPCCFPSRLQINYAISRINMQYMAWTLLQKALDKIA